MANLGEIYKTAKEASIEFGTTWMLFGTGTDGTGCIADETLVALMARDGNLVAFRFDNGEKTVGLHG